MTKRLKRFLSILLIVFVLLAVPSTTAGAAVTAAASAGAGLTVDVTVNSDTDTVAVTWSEVTNAASYYLYFLNKSENHPIYGTDFVQIGKGVQVSASEPCSYLFGHNYTYAYGLGTQEYRINVIALDPYGDMIAGADAKSDVFTTDIPILSAPKVTLSSGGYLSWTKVAHAAIYNVALYTEKGSLAASYATDDTTLDVSAKLLKGYRYYATVQAGNPAGGYRYSSEAKSAVVDADGSTPYVTGLKWSGNTLSWNACSGAKIYALTLYRAAPYTDSFQRIGSTVYVTATSCDLSDLFQTCGVGTYRVEIQAGVNATTALSFKTTSPDKRFGADRILSGQITSFLDDEGTVTVTLTERESGHVVDTRTPEGNSVGYRCTGLFPGTYTLRFEKENHAAREYVVTVGLSDVVQDAKLHPVGDINGDGKITNMDFGRANSHVKGVNRLSGYELQCADVVKNDGEVTNMDAGRINSHVKGIVKLW